MASNSNRDAIVIVGAGIIGLNVASILADQGLGQYVTVIAEHLPGDTSINYTSPWAGANFSAISGNDANALRWDRTGYQHLTRLAQQVGAESFVQQTPSTEYWDDKVSDDKMQSLSKYLNDFQIVPETQLPAGVTSGLKYTTVTINAPEHIKFLHRRLQTQHGVRFLRKKIADIKDAYLSPQTQVVFNCTGNASAQLAGVEDPKCYPTRGQILLVKAPDVHQNVMRHGRDYVTYIIPRPFSNGNVILGGYMQKGVSTSDTFSHETESILERTSELSSEVRNGNAEIMAVLAGLRPSREGGARVEAVKLKVRDQDRLLVHNYGAGGTGFQAGYGMAVDAVASAKPILDRLSSRVNQAKL
ncbi:FAD dependent oxidoreductase [Apiospora sp. TS-2023a]